MSGQRCARASIPKEVGWERENQRGHWVDSWDAKRSTSATLNRSQIWATVRQFSIHSPDLSYCLNKVGRYVQDPWDMDHSQGWTFFLCPKEECLGCATGSLHGDWCVTPPPYCPSWQWHESVPGTEESEWEPDEPLSFPSCFCARWGTCPSSHSKPACPRRPHPILRGSSRRDHLAMADYSYVHSFLEKIGVLPHWEGLETSTWHSYSNEAQDGKSSHHPCGEEWY